MKTTIESPTASLGSLIVCTPGVAGGKPCIRGHRVPVHRIAGWWRLGLAIEDIAEKHPSLSPAEIHAALAYYHLNRAEIEGSLAEERAVVASPPAQTAAM
ncbi:MAG: DUF433 domain-containing protein [Verrucomicrobia bacterium]|nr:DUF433 domain-containing protein [Verrucomicrobiota bacterium]